ncbi:hypothetical protein VC87395_002049 [Vibrio paracholerae 87395]|nr:hypothetical protein VC87395_002049 [Vibrio paracholerae 87395]
MHKSSLINGENPPLTYHSEALIASESFKNHANKITIFGE